MAAAVERHLALLDAAIAAHGGVHFKTVGDAVQAAFPTAPQAVAAAVEGAARAARRGLGERSARCGCGWRCTLGGRHRMHAATTSPPRSIASSRLLDAAHGGQVLLSDAVAGLARDALPEDVTLEALGEYRLRDILQPEKIFQLRHPALPAYVPAAQHARTRAPITSQSIRRRSWAGSERRRRSPTSCCVRTCGW